MKNVELKKELIENGKLQQYRNIRRDVLETYPDFIREALDKDTSLAKAVYNLTWEEIRACEQVRHNMNQQVKKVLDHLTFLFEGQWHLYFVTFTFTDDVLKNTKPKTRREKIVRLLSKYCDDFLLNIDYAPETGREHFHAVICVLDSFNDIYFDDDGHLRLEFLDRYYKYGHYKAKMIKTTGIDAKRVAKYLTKLTLHSVKVAQSYISVKKGSPYQKYKELKKEVKRASKTPGRLYEVDFEDEYFHLLSGNASNGKKYKRLPAEF